MPRTIRAEGVRRMAEEQATGVAGAVPGAVEGRPGATATRDEPEIESTTSAEHATPDGEPAEPDATGTDDPIGSVDPAVAPEAAGPTAEPVAPVASTEDIEPTTPAPSGPAEPAEPTQPAEPEGAATPPSVDHVPDPESDPLP